MIYIPQLAYCFNNRKTLAKKHPNTTEPNEWFSSTYLNAGYFCLNFDFFVNWGGKPYTLSDEFWIKRVVNKGEFDYWPCMDQSILQPALEICDGKDFLVSYGEFAKSLGFEAKYQIFVDSSNWKEYPAKFITLTIDETGVISKVEKNDLDTIKNEIQRLSGGTVNVTKARGLSVASTNLECHLSNDQTGAAWPGDVDLLIFDNNKVPVAIIEFKKNGYPPGHEKHQKMIDETFNNYYDANGKADDNRKYNRIAIFRDEIGEDIPIINIFYPAWESTDSSENIIKIEKVVGGVGSLQVDSYKTLPVPYTAKDKAVVVKTVLSMI